MNYVVDSYENYKEENRLTTNNARRIEFVTTTRVLDEIIDTKSKILDCAAGTGIYAFWFADEGHDVTATDITPRHIDIINRTLTNKNYQEEVEFPENPVSPNKKMNIAIAFLLGLMVSLGLVFLLEYLDNTYKNKEQLEKELDIPVLGVIPDVDIL